MDQVPFSKFPKPDLNFFSRGKAIFHTDLRLLRSREVRQFLYSYWVSSGSISGNTGKTDRIVVKGSPVQHNPRVYNRTVGIISRIDWAFRPLENGEADLILSLFTNGVNSIYYCSFIIDNSLSREGAKSVVNPLLAAARMYGMPASNTTFRYDYSGKNPIGSEQENERFFKVLGLRPTDNLGLIKAAYRELAKQFHPDAQSNKGHIGEERMKEINDAYEQLMKRHQ